MRKKDEDDGREKEKNSRKEKDDESKEKDKTITRTREEGDKVVRIRDPKPDTHLWGTQSRGRTLGPHRRGNG